MITLYGSAKTRAFRVLWLLEELGLAYDQKPVPPHAPELRDLSPLGKVPVMTDGDAVLTDSTAILTYLADGAGAFTHPAGTTARAQQDAMTHFVLDEMDGVLWTAAKHSFVLPEDKRVAGVKETLGWEFHRAVERLMDLKGDAPYLAGDTPTIPDILACHCGGWAVVAKFGLQNDAFKAYGTSLRERPAYERARARP